ncbi:cytosolic 5'-nucleotidase 1A-like [Callorhinchus milii]|uniref:cytosolic 5'-nucleotidase 1A-like n=1 Tax=Callorhinchus milii TaxID=7868 RepID=UPI001C3FF571|nr:cytosolic 5'-nucleotidase 1A-like [Callorhinchus milii]
MEAGDQIIVNTEVTQKDSAQAVTIAVSSRAIFDLEEEHELFLAEGMGNYTSHQIAHENEPLAEGTALPFIRAVQMVNEKLLENNPEEKQLFDIILVSNNNAQSGLRIINSIKHYGLHITRFCFLNGIDPSKYLQSYNVKLFLSANESAVCSALKRGIPAALVIQQDVQTAAEQLRVVFDGDCVLFSDESENVYREKGLDEVIKYEKDREHIPIGENSFDEVPLDPESPERQWEECGGPAPRKQVQDRFPEYQWPNSRNPEKLPGREYRRQLSAGHLAICFCRFVF